MTISTTVNSVDLFMGFFRHWPGIQMTFKNKNFQYEKVECPMMNLWNKHLCSFFEFSFENNLCKFESGFQS